MNKNRAIIDNEITQGAVGIGLPKAYNYDAALVETAKAIVEEELDIINTNGLVEKVVHNSVYKLNSPLDSYGAVDNGTDGQILRTKGDGTTEWVVPSTPSDEQVAEVVTQWLDDHPEATTTVEDGSLTRAKFTNALDIGLAVSCQTVQQMIADTSLKADYTVATKGYWSVNDGGEGLYHIRAKEVSDVHTITLAGSTVDVVGDNGSVIAIGNWLDPDNVSLVAELITDGTVNVKQFGAKGNANYHNLADGNWYESMDITSAQTAPYIDNVTTEYYKNYGTAVFGTEGTYLNPADGKHYVNYDSDTDTYSDEAPYHDNVADKWYVTATYSNPANAYVDGVWYYGAVFSVPAQDDTSFIQKAIDFCGSKKCNLEFVKARYVNTALTISKQFIIEGNGAILAKPNLKLAPYNMTASQMKWVRQMTISYSGADDSELLNIRNLEFDNNVWCMWKISDGYAQEQASCIIAYGDASKPGRLNIQLENLYLHDSPSDGIHLRNNVNATVLNCRSLDCYRGGLVITGGYSNINVDWFRFDSPHVNDGIDIEVDGAGYGGSGAVNVRMNNIDIDDDLDLGVGGDSVVYINNLRQRGYGGARVIYGKLVMTNSFVRMADDGLAQSMGAFNCYFENVIFDGTKRDGSVGNSFPNAFVSATIGGSLTFKNCTFQNGIDGICGSKTAYENDISVNVDGCLFKNLTRYGVGGMAGNVGYLVAHTYIRNCVFDMDENTGVCFFACGGVDSNEVSYKGVTVAENNVYKKAKYMFLAYRPHLILNESPDIMMERNYQNGFRSDSVIIGKRMTYVSSIPTVSGINLNAFNYTSKFEDYATDGQTVWKYSGSGTTWNVVS